MGRLRHNDPLPELIEAVREYHHATGRRVTLAWTLIAGVNTRREDARQLAELTVKEPGGSEPQPAWARRTLDPSEGPARTLASQRRSDGSAALARSLLLTF